VYKVYEVICIENNFLSAALHMQMADAAKELEACNGLSGRFGLVLSGEQLLRLTESRFLALKSTGRVEFGEGVLKKLVYAFCDSPYLTQQNYESTLTGLQDIFYYFKNESIEALSDDELIEAMKTAFDGKAQGSLEYLAGTALESLCRGIRGGEVEEPAPPLYEEEYE